MGKLKCQKHCKEWVEVYMGPKVRKKKHKIFDLEDIRRYVTEGFRIVKSTRV